MNSEETDKPDTGCSKCTQHMKINRSLLPIKFFFFTFLGGVGSVIPYVAVFLKQLGMGAQQIGLISGVRPVVGFISAPLWGILGDRYKIRRHLLLFSIVAWIAVYVGLYHIPQAERAAEDRCPDRLHRTPVHIHTKHKRPTQHNNVSMSQRNYTQAEADILREDIGWIYDPGGLNRVFLIAFCVIIIGEFFQAPTIALSDAGAIQTLGPGCLDRYGAQRAWGAVGWAIR